MEIYKQKSKQKAVRFIYENQLTVRLGLFTNISLLLGYVCLRKSADS